MIKRIVIVLIGILVVVLGRGFFLYSGFYQAPPSEMPSYEHLIAPAVPSTEFSDNISQKGEGTILLDLAHDNALDVEELNVLTSRLISRGLTIKLLTVDDDLEKELLGEKDDRDEEEEGDQEKEDQEEEELEEKLPPADAFIVVCPQAEFFTEEIKTVDEFVNNGGKLLLIADPTRSSQINSLSLKFGLIFQPDYLYNMRENDANYRNIFVSDFKENPILKHLEKIALYTAGSITSDNCSIALVDENTFSSLIETRKELSPVALANEAKVLAIHDLTFMTEPYNGILDNNRLVSNIADWLATPAEEAEVEEEEEIEEEEEKEEVEEEEVEEEVEAPEK